ncbi:hypothetical protein [Bartonella saheliensis]|uniref:hypothetical protein n=1 Tax=Bartonella saheliensis TaxID=1457016 RepID=UPI001AA05B99|nr:hypothetical protein [Bartonella saheliensis]
MSKCFLRTKSKKADSDSVLYYSRNTNARALARGGGSQTRSFQEHIPISKKIRFKSLLHFYCQSSEMALGIKRCFNRILDNQKSSEKSKL